MTKNLSYSGLEGLFPNFSPGRLWGTILRVKFVRLKALPLSIEPQGPEVLVRFHVDDNIEEREERWRGLHFSCWQYLS